MIKYLKNGCLLVLSGIGIVMFFFFNFRLASIIVIILGVISVPFYLYYGYRYLNIKDFFWSNLSRNDEKEYVNYVFHRPLLIMSFSKEKHFQHYRNRAILKYDRKLAREMIVLEKKLGLMELLFLWSLFFSFPYLGALIK